MNINSCNTGWCKKSLFLWLLPVCWYREYCWYSFIGFVVILVYLWDMSYIRRYISNISAELYQFPQIHSSHLFSCEFKEFAFSTIFYNETSFFDWIKCFIMVYLLSFKKTKLTLESNKRSSVLRCTCNFSCWVSEQNSCRRITFTITVQTNRNILFLCVCFCPFVYKKSQSCRANRLFLSKIYS